MNLYVGTSGYSYKEWKDKFYPADLPAHEMLHYYSQHFRTVEINNTFYRMPKASVVEGWAREVPGEFKFACKAPQRITHMHQLKNVADSVIYFFDVVTTLNERLGPLLFQLPPYFQKEVSRLREFLEFLRNAPYRIAFEFRHQSWFEDDVFELLREHKKALCIAEAENELDVPFVQTTDWGYLRLRRMDYGERQLKSWRKRIRESGWKDAFVYFKHEEEATGPELAKRFLELAEEELVATGKA